MSSFLGSSEGKGEKEKGLNELPTGDTYAWPLNTSNEEDFSPDFTGSPVQKEQEITEFANVCFVHCIKYSFVTHGHHLSFSIELQKPFDWSSMEPFTSTLTFKIEHL